MQESIQKVEERDTSFRNAVAQYFEDAKTISTNLIVIDFRATIQVGFEGDRDSSGKGEPYKREIEGTGKLRNKDHLHGNCPG